MENASQVIVGGEDVIGLLLADINTSGHVPLEDVPEMGKTLPVKAVAKSPDRSFKNIQFTPNRLPSDFTGIIYFNQKTCEFQFHPKPGFSNILPVDEISRAAPGTQPSPPECMEEKQVAILLFS